MQITRQADYAIRAVRYLAKHYVPPKSFIEKDTDQNNPATTSPDRIKIPSTSTVAKEMKIPASFLAKIISQLSIAGLLHTSRGARGGVTLARDPSEISILDVVEAIDGPILLNVCVGDPADCVFSDECLVHPIWVEVQESLVKRLRETKFDQLHTK
jgi:Rrf2 family protein